MGGSGSGANTIKYYYAGGQRIALRDSGGLKFIHGDHLRSTSRLSCGDTACGTIGAQARIFIMGYILPGRGTQKLCTLCAPMAMITMINSL